MSAPRPVPRCGTDGGYFRHLRGTRAVPPTVPCDACRAAHAAAQRAYTARRVAEGRPLPPKRRGKPRQCPDCGGPVSDQALRCRRCTGARRRALAMALDGGWVTVRGIKRAAVVAAMRGRAA